MHARSRRRGRHRRRPPHRRVVVRLGRVPRGVRQGGRPRSSGSSWRRASSPGAPWQRAWSSRTARDPCTSRSPPPSRCSSSTARPSSRCAGCRLRVPVVLGLWPGSGSLGAGGPSAAGSTGSRSASRTPSSAWTSAFFVFSLPLLRFLVGFADASCRPGFVAAAFTHYLYGGLRSPGRGPTTRGRRAHLGASSGRSSRCPRGVVLAGPYSLSPEGPAAHRHHLHRRQRRAARRKAILAIAALMSPSSSSPRSASRSWRLPLIGVALLVVIGRRGRRHLPGARPALPGAPERRRRSRRRTSSATSTRPGRRTASTGIKAINDATTAETATRRAARRRRDDAAHPHHGPQRSSARRSGSSSRSSALLPVPGHRSTSTATDRRQRRTRSSRCASSTSPACPTPAQLAQRPHRLHPRLRRRRGLRQPAHDRRAAGRSSSAASRRRASSASSSRASTSARTRRPTPIVGAPEGPTPIELDYPAGARATARRTRPTPATAACRSARTSSPARLRDQVPASRTSCSRTRSTTTRRSSTTATRRERVQKVAPYLTLDGDPYPAVVDGRVKWIVDGYTTSDELPVLQPAQQLGDGDRRRGDARGRNVVAVVPDRSTTSATRSRRQSTPTTAR